jgi:uncharacterized protein (DUF305 family)
MMTHKFNSQKPLVYGLIGFLTGAISASLIVNVKPESSPLASSTTPPSNPIAKLVDFLQASPTSAQVTKPSILGTMAHSDQHFIVMMIPHHEDAVAMADLAISRAKRPEIKTLAKAIKATQTQEIQQMQIWYKQWYGTDVPVWSPGMGMMQRRNTSIAQQRGMMGRGHNMGRGAMGTDLIALKNAPDFDQEFILQMVPHHQMEVMMSSMVASSATHLEVRTLAQSIIRSQSAEIEQMQQWYQTWYPQ